MLDRSQFMPIVYLKKAKFTGSYKGMRYRMEKASRPAESGGEGEEAGVVAQGIGNGVGDPVGIQVHGAFAV